MFGFRKRGARLNLALQGGGAHGAFTWGVLDRLLDEADIEFGWLSGTSAGAVNAVAFADGLAEGGRAGARERLRAVWEAVIEAGVPDLLRLNPFLYGMSRSPTIGQVASLFSPYDFNPLGFDPMRKLLEQHIDFERLRGTDGVGLLIAATDVATARPRLFRRAEMTVEAVLASACLPQVHHAVEIEGRAYWDGGFSANPDLVTLASESPVGDTLLVLLNPVEKPGPPRSAREIAADVSRVTFSQPLIRDIIEIAAHTADIGPQRGWSQKRPRTRGERIARHRFHLIEAGRHVHTLPPESKMRPERALLTYLHNAGREEARRWLGRAKADIGRRSSVDLAGRLLGPMRSLRAEPVAGAGEAGGQPEEHEVKL
ncbi:MAG: patatin-like phospholipase family protein [Hyphomicrobiaceae bacterium]|nr:patatin-like phospholipase family protein [Hyphomicrobiaceae bacterium]